MVSLLSEFSNDYCVKHHCRSNQRKHLSRSKNYTLRTLRLSRASRRIDSPAISPGCLKEPAA